MMMMLMALSSTNVMALICEPKPGANPQTGKVGLTLCESGSRIEDNNLSDFSASWLGNGLLSASIPFQIRSCGDFYCNRATRFSLKSDGLTLNDKKGSSQIPLTVTVRQIHTGSEITFPDNRDCESGTTNCPFRGAGRQRNLSPDFCESCVDFELLISADLNALINSNTLTTSGTHSGTLTFTIDQALESSNTGSGDSGLNKDVDITIKINIPDLVQISGLNDMTLSKNSSVAGRNYFAVQPFCVYRLGGGKFAIKAEGTGVSAGDSFRLAGNSQSTTYKMKIGRTDKKLLVDFKQEDTKSSGQWRGDCESFGNNLTGDTNMTLEVRINKAEADSLPAGVYTDTMTLTVIPK
ncbi:hypothetical protein [Endozoicomonas sp. SCSIO W0465]|uniref:hypothetical protein n=1 Tax=Endozoicomonas sp. SCSIO W0465 TaxID=2918516 RepID=UPI002074E3B4|nr:hypothetical protein [Endozoicomonas sp. SCSIO W0465]USE37018.1 hypothetical protein MJO57_01925 [Endozoicomonas sp. SCSIO W0465]